MSADPQVTELLRAWSDGDSGARDRLVPVVYKELRRSAAAFLRRERSGHTLQPTALVHEAYLRLVDQRRTMWRNRAQFFGVAAELMRRILVDRARARRAAKRSGQWGRVTLDPHIAVTKPIDVEVLDLDSALSELAAFDARKSRIAELRFFAGLSLEETGEVLGLSVATVERDWQVARAWLFDALSRDAPQASEDPRRGVDPKAKRAGLGTQSKGPGLAPRSKGPGLAPRSKGPGLGPRSKGPGLGPRSKNDA